jgi:hypothetical protein
LLGFVKDRVGELPGDRRFILKLPVNATEGRLPDDLDRDAFLDQPRLQLATKVIVIFEDMSLRVKILEEVGRLLKPRGTAP